MSESVSCVVSKEEERDKGGVVHAGDVQKLIAAKVELGSGVTRRSTWYRG